MTDTPQPEYCDCPGYHDGSCSVRHIERLDKLCNDLHAALERAERDRDTLAAEVRAWRSWEYRCDATWDAEERTDASGALTRAKESNEQL